MNSQQAETDAMQDALGVSFPAQNHSCSWTTELCHKVHFLTALTIAEINVKTNVRTEHNVRYHSTKSTIGYITYGTESD